jgi:3-hydroxyisobutyrate dehydrogenase-like beta-hydroxyacid dehydrogenase
MKSVKTVGILGLGKMGVPMARHLVERGFEVIGCDPLAEARRKGVKIRMGLGMPEGPGKV